MATSTIARSNNDSSSDNPEHEMLSRLFANMLRHFKECSDDVQMAIVEMSQIVNSPDSSEDEKEMAVLTIREALFPQHHNGSLGADIEELEHSGMESSPEMATVIAELNAEEAEFSDRVRTLMESRGMTQAELAELSGVGQPAISMMLSRNCRPQHRTIERLARALQVSAEDLWPQC